MCGDRHWSLLVVAPRDCGAMGHVHLQVEGEVMPFIIVAVICLRALRLIPEDVMFQILDTLARLK